MLNISFKRERGSHFRKKTGNPSAESRRLWLAPGRVASCGRPRAGVHRTRPRPRLAGEQGGPGSVAQLPAAPAARGLCSHPTRGEPTAGG